MNRFEGGSFPHRVLGIHMWLPRSPEGFVSSPASHKERKSMKAKHGRVFMGHLGTGIVTSSHIPLIGTHSHLTTRGTGKSM